MIAVTEATAEAAQTDESILVKLAAGDSRALGALYDRYGRLAFFAAGRMLGDRAAAEDVVQDVFIAIWKHAASFDPGRGRVRTWLLASVRHRCIDVLRGQPMSTSRESVGEDVTSGSSDDVWEAFGSKIDADEIRRALALLPEDQRAMIYLNYYRGLTHRQIAAHLRIPLGTVKGRMRLAIHKLRKSFLVAAKVSASA
jgi:RNA polymerase sigma-70 factor (ECF subfamily)